MNPIVGAISTVVAGVVVVGTAALVLHSAPTTPPMLTATKTGEAAASLELATYPDSSHITWRRTDNGVGPHTDWVSYGPTTELQVPAHTLITVTINQYDSGEAMPNAFLAQVHGTVGGTITIDGETVTSVDAEHVGHTFTIHNFPSSTQDPLFVSVPLPAVDDAVIEAADAQGVLAKPHVVTFQFMTGSAGTYAWNCEFPCGGNYANMGEAMSSYGYMSGTLHVV